MTNSALSAERSARSGKGWSVLLRLAMPMVIIGLLWSLADGPTAFALLGDLEWAYVALAFVAVNVQTIASAWRWHRVAAKLGQAISPQQAAAEYYLSQVVNQSLPGGVLGDAARAIRTRHEVGLGIAAKAIIIERLAGQIAMFALLAVSLIWAMLVPGGLALDFQQWHLAAALTVLVLFAIAFRTTLQLARRKGGIAFGTSLHTALFSDRAWAEHLALGTLIVALNLSSFTLCAMATGTVLNAEAVLVLIPLILCAMLIPATIAGWGFREGAAAALFPLAGASAAAGFAASIAFGLVILAASLPGLLVLVASGPVDG